VLFSLTDTARSIIVGNILKTCRGESLRSDRIRSSAKERHLPISVFELLKVPINSPTRGVEVVDPSKLTSTGRYRRSAPSRDSRRLLGLSRA